MPADRKNTANKIDIKTSARPNGSLEKNYNLFLSAFNTMLFRRGSGTMLPAKPILAAGYTRPHPAPRKRREGGSVSSNSSGANYAEPAKISDDPHIGNADHNSECGNRPPTHDGVEADSSGGLERVGQRARLVSYG
jgi:hypothetical protein